MGILSRVRGRGAAWVAALAATALLSSGCFSHQAPMHDAPPAAGPSAAPDGTPLSGSYDDGAREGEQAAEGEVVAHYFVLGAVTAPLIVLCIIGLANSKDGGGNCGGGGGTVAAGGATVAPRYLPPNASYRSPEYNDGYNQAYETRLNQRQGTAFGFGFLTGAVLTAVGIGIYLSQENNRDNVEDEAGQHMTAGGRSRRGFAF